MKTVFKKFIGLLLMCALVQLIQPKKNEGTYNLQPFFEVSNVSKGVQTILLNACTDCHSNKTNYLWYSEITPINFWIANHVNKGKEYVNFSEWNTYNNNQKKRILNQLIKEVKQRKMPLKTYIIKHPKAKLNKKQIEELVEWATQLKQSLPL